MDGGGGGGGGCYNGGTKQINVTGVGNGNGSVLIVWSATPLPVPTIHLGNVTGQDITGTPQSAIAGEPITLFGDTSGVVPDSVSWYGLDSTVGGYSPTQSSYSTGSVTATSIITQTGAFYCIAPQASQTVTFAYPVGVQTASATVTYTVQGPQHANIVAAPGAVAAYAVFNQKTGLYHWLLSFGRAPTAPLPGMSFTGTA